MSNENNNTARTSRRKLYVLGIRMGYDVRDALASAARAERREPSALARIWIEDRLAALAAPHASEVVTP